MKRLICVLLCVAVLCAPVLAVTTADSLDKQVEDFMRDNNLNETNFSYLYYNTVTKVSYSYNMSAFFPVGEVWTLPLNMYFYEQESKGAYQPPVTDPDWEFTINGMNLSQCRYQSILQKNNEVSLQMRDSLGDMSQYKQMINERFGHVKAATLPEKYLTGNYYSAAFLMNCLLSIYKHPELYADMMKNYELVQEDNGIASYTNPYHLVHVYGKEDGMICDLGEINAPANYLLVAFVSEEAGGDAILAALNDILCDCVEAEAGVYVDDNVQKHERSESDYIINSKDRSDRTELLKWIGISVGGAVGLLIIIGGIVWIVNRRREFDNY